MKSTSKTLALWLVMIIVFLALFKAVNPQGPVRKPIKYSEFIALVNDQKVNEVIVRGNQVLGTLKPEAVTAGTPGGYSAFEVTRDQSDDEFYKVLRQHNVNYDVQEPEKGTFWQQILLSWFPMLFLVFLLVMFMRQLQAGGGKAMSFGKSRARLLNENTKKVTFKDVAGADEAKDELAEIIEFLKDPKKFSKLGGRIPKGVLMMGPPGTGKTLLARAVAGEAGVPFFSISGSDFVEMFVGVGASRVRDLFEQGKKHAPCIIFIDEIDAVGRHRGAGLGGGHDEREQTLNQLLVEMDGFEGNDGVILIAATNRPDVLDPALLRPGRFDRRVVVSLPDVRGREEILKVHTRKTPLGADIDLSVTARGTPGFSGADLENLVNEAALIAARMNKKQVDKEDIEHARDKVLMGSERRSMVISDEDRRTTAYHEAGHAIVTLELPGMDPLHKVTIIPRGRALGLTQTLPKEDTLNMDKVKAENMIALLMGGRLAEELVLNQKTTGAGNDIERATDIARRMVCEWGMSDTLGPLNFGQKEGEVFLGRDIAQTRDVSEETSQSIDREIRDIVNRNYQRAKKILSSKMDALHALAKGLLEYETLDGAEVAKIVRGEKLDRTPRPRTPPTATADASSKAAGNSEPGREGGGPAPAPLPA